MIINASEIRHEDSAESLTTRPIRLADKKMEAEFIHRLSPESKHYRFLGGMRELSPQLLTEFCDVDGKHSMAFVATIREDGHETVVGVSRYAPNAKEDWRELTVTIADAWQNKGIGTLLAQKLNDFAKGHGVKNLYSVDFTDNIHMKQGAKELGMQAQRDPDDAHQVIYSVAIGISDINMTSCEKNTECVV